MTSISVNIYIVQKHTRLLQPFLHALSELERLAAQVAPNPEFISNYFACSTGEHIQLPNGSFAFTKREPIGVVAGIGSFNYPFQMSLWKSAAALACGNTIVFKPSEKTPLSCVLLGEAYTEAGLPPGCYNVLQVDAFVRTI